jgi:hypothetical protein
MQVTLNQAATIIRNVGTTNTVLLQGQPGVGKSAILSTIARQLPDYLPCYIDVANLDLGDLGMPVIDRDAMITNYAPNARFGIGKGQNRPVLLMLDELGKAARPVLNMLLPVILEHRLGDVNLPTGSIVFGTTNLATDGVGDNIPAHAYDRVLDLDLGNPTVDNWLMWAVDNNIAPEVMAFAKEFPQIFDRYDLCDAGDKNPYNFNPMMGRTKKFCSCRGLELASNVIRNRDALGDALLPALCGTVGEAAARDMEAMVMLSDQLPRFASVMADPRGCKLPGSVGAYFLMAFSLASRADAANLTDLMTYVNRFESFEAGILFASSLAGNKAKVGMACSNRAFTQVAAKFGKYF